MGGLSNTQAAYRYYHEDFMRRLRQRARDLWIDGYRVTASDEPATFLVFKELPDEPTGDESGTLALGETYKVNPLTDTCTCAFFTKQANGEPLTDDGEQVPCKHLIGLPGLVREELDFLTMRRDHTADARREMTYQQMIDALRDPWALAGK